MATGLDYVQAAMALCERLSPTIEALPGLDRPAADDLAARLSQVRAAFAGMQDRFFLRSKLCLPFAVRCEQEAKKLEGALGGWTADALPSRAVQEALSALEQAVKALDDRSGAQGMVIT